MLYIGDTLRTSGALYWGTLRAQVLYIEVPLGPQVLCVGDTLGQVKMWSLDFLWMLLSFVRL